MFVEVNRDCSDAEIKNAYKREISINHPDKVRFLD
jgi:DnaJ-class molecular chaperone